MIAFMTLMVVPNAVSAKNNNPKSAPTEVPANVQVMLNRLNEIKEMDKSSLSSIEKKELRTEVKTIKSTLRSTGNGVYLSVGAIIIVILLLILLL